MAKGGLGLTPKVRKELAVPVEELETPIESAEEAASPIFHHPRSMKDLYGTKVRKDDVGYYVLYMSDLAHQDPNKEMQVRQLKEAGVRAWKMDDELLQSMKDLENTRVGLPRLVVDDYKESAGFKEGLKRMGRVTYEYDYQVALACFCSSHQDSEVEEDPFTIRPEDDSMPMERQQAFDDSDPPES
ncbi:hypothetical protein B296_00010771 [Ensete ventricosum]|uniref:Uncharacterized protein n=1 Tax=Ensete ventricosum TaxID=4639 RepID=A0A426ZNS4_ENSVE|nr:hypothetical protein B296_00010771 [Ensete ventricosum]